MKGGRDSHSHQSFPKERYSRNKNVTCLSLWFWQWLTFSDFLRSHFWTTVLMCQRLFYGYSVDRCAKISLPCLHVAQVPCIGISPFGRGAQQQPTFVDFTSVCSWGTIPELNGGFRWKIKINGGLSSKLCFEYQRVCSICFFPHH